MIKNYLITSFRNLRRNWNFTVINITGLTLGLACCLLIFFALRFELSFDKHHHDGDRIYRFADRNKEHGDKGYNVGAPLPLLAALRNDFPEIRNAVTNTYASKEMLITVGQGEKRKKFIDPINSVSFIDPEYFNIFDYTWLKGSPASSLTNPGSVVLSTDQAKKYFGNADPMGKTIRVNNRMNFVVSGIIDNPPTTTSFPFTVMLSYSSLKEYGANTSWDDWQSTYGGGQVYMKLPESFSKSQMEKQLTAFAKKYRDPKDAAENDWILQPMHDIHFATNTQNYAGRSISKGLIWSMILVGSFILITACVNFVNLATAQALRRAREVGIRKVLGSTRGQLLRQYFSETGIITVLSVLLALIIAQLSLPYVSQILNVKSQGTLFITDPVIMGFLAILCILTTVLSGFYPALVVSGYQPILALKGKVGKSGRQQSNLRRGLIVLQFTISQVVLIGTIIAYSQMKYFRTLDLGFQKDEIINVPLPEQTDGKLENLQAKLKSVPGLKSMSFSAFTPMSKSNWQTRFKYENNEDVLDFEIVMRPADTSYVKTYGLTLLAGRTYLPADTMREYIINEAFVKKLGFKNPQDVIGKRMAIGGGGIKLPIVGVVKNFNTYSLHREIIPCVLTTSRNNYGTLGLKLTANATTEQLSQIEKAWTETFPDYMFKYTYLDQTLNSFYEKEEQLFSLFRILTGIAIFIGCLGLYGVVAFMAESRTKEMGIRKAVGASAFHIFGLFSGDFVKLVLIALVLASPIAWYTMDGWLKDYTYRIEISWWIFALAGFMAVIIALITISFQSVKAALMNPVKALRSE
ncbi:ABC transporter permease [Dyadobacter sp. LHD-138]|uniref:ABC transporter permease n=1 Tax=Dyadobacter sp. LHD-138 TaxID=3071413 RepID=UPI0027E0F6CE|nr:ABC transporter permease [Dyadobacter sp. LHD-138]MDQ6477896.1 ABC transporter permease [Dyadobacter sp. LHD-138]